MNPSSRFQGRAGTLAGGLCCFAVLGAAHFLALCAFDLSGQPKSAAPVKRELRLMFEFPPPPLPAVEPAPQLAAPPAEETSRAVETIPLAAPSALAEPAPEAALSAGLLAERSEPQAAETLPLPGDAAPLGETYASYGAAAVPGASGGPPAATAMTAAARRMSEDDYLALILRRLEEKKVYPLAMRKRGIQGEVSVSFTVRPDGSLGALQPPANASHPFLAQAALETVRAASPFPVMEGRAGDYAVRITIRYQLASADE